jgi:hypothetical protein
LFPTAQALFRTAQALFRTAQALFRTAQTLFPTAQALREIQNWLAKSSQSFQHQWLVHFATESQGAKSKQKSINQKLKFGKQKVEIKSGNAKTLKC